MEQVKIFYEGIAANVEGEVEERINEWLRAMGGGIEITRVTHAAYGTSVSHNFSMAIFYSKK